NHTYKNVNLMLVAETEQQLASALTNNSEYAKAKPHLERALQLFESAQRTDHPDQASTVGALALVYAHTNEIGKPREPYERSIHIREASVGPNPPALAPTLNTLADLLNKHGDSAGALPYVERALKLAEVFGRTNPIYQTIASTHGEVLARLGRVAEGRKEL